MKLETEPLLRSDDPALADGKRWPAWRVALPLVVVAVAGILAVYWRTAESIVDDLVALGDVPARLSDRADLRSS